MSDTTLTGTAAIGRALDNLSPSTVERLIKRGLLKAYKIPGGGRTSPWRMARSEIARFREVMRNGEAQRLDAAE